MSAREGSALVMSMPCSSKARLSEDLVPEIIREVVEGRELILLGLGYEVEVEVCKKVFEDVEIQQNLQGHSMRQW
jgi:hypothetical protein